MNNLRSAHLNGMPLTYSCWTANGTEPCGDFTASIKLKNLLTTQHRNFFYELIYRNILPNIYI